MRYTEAYHLAHEAIERALAANAKTEDSRGDHLMKAEHHADCAWSISENFDFDFDPDSAEDVVFHASRKLKSRTSNGAARNLLRR